MSKKNFPKALPDFHLGKSHVKALRKARDLITNLSETYLCCALHTVKKSAVGTENQLKVARAVADLTRFIDRAIKGEGYFEDWQSKNGLTRTSPERRQDRLDWINYILKKTPKQETPEDCLEG